MKRTFTAERWDYLVLTVGGDKESCTVDQLVEFLQQRQREAEQAGLENVRLVYCRSDYDATAICLVGDREETDAERQTRTETEERQERRALLDYIAEQHRPKLRGERHESWRQDCDAMIQQKGWDKLSLVELRLKAVGLG